MFMKKPDLLSATAITTLFICLFIISCSHHPLQLPIYYPENVKKTIVNGKESIDTIYHTISPFRFIDQHGDTVTEKKFQNKIYVANFFFTTCQTICPKMMFQMERVNEAIQNMPDLLILSHTVNPSHDSVPVLADYAKLINADPKKWMLITGKKKEIYDIAIDGYKLGVSENVREPGGFLHSQTFVLVDKKERVRGYYDGMDSSEVNKLICDIKILRAEYEIK